MTVKPGTVILHSRAGDVVPFTESEELVKAIHEVEDLGF
jgi:hypothetical protein